MVLPAPFSPTTPEDGAARDLQVHSVQRQGLAEPARQPVDLHDDSTLVARSWSLHPLSALHGLIPPPNQLHNLTHGDVKLPGLGEQGVDPFGHDLQSRSRRASGDPALET